MTNNDYHRRRALLRVVVFLSALAAALAVLGALAGCSALDRLRGASSMNPDVQKGVKLLETNDVAGAVAQFDRAIKQHPHDASIYAQIAMGCGEQRHWDLAAQYADQGIANTEHSPAADRARLFNLAGMAYMQKGDPQKAVELYETVVRLAPDDPVALNNLGYALADAYEPDMPNGQQQLERALSLTSRAVQLAQESAQTRPETVADFLDSVAWAQFKLRRYTEAIANLRRALDAHPQSPEINYHLGRAYAKVGRYADAALEYDRALRIQPDYKPAADAKDALPPVPPPPAPAGKKAAGSPPPAPAGTNVSAPPAASPAGTPGTTPGTTGGPAPKNNGAAPAGANSPASTTGTAGGLLTPTRP